MRTFGVKRYRAPGEHGRDNAQQNNHRPRKSLPFAHGGDKRNHPRKADDPAFIAHAVIDDKRQERGEHGPDEGRSQVKRRNGNPPYAREGLAERGNRERNEEPSERNGINWQREERR